jgi:ribosomal protein S25
MLENKTLGKQKKELRTLKKCLKNKVIQENPRVRGSIAREIIRILKELRLLV